MAQRNIENIPFGHRSARTVDRVNTLEGRVEALATMSLMQMLSDAYEDAQIIWERNKEQGVEENDDPESYGPNEAQKVVEDFLVWAHFMPRQERHFLPKKVDTTVQPPPQTQRRKTVSAPSHRWRHYLDVASLSPRKLKRSTSCTHDADGPASPSSSPLSKFWKRLRSTSVTSGKSSKKTSHSSTLTVATVTPHSDIPTGDVVVAPKPYNFVRRPRFNTDLPYRKAKTLRRMNWQDTHALMAYARTLRRRKLPLPSPQPFPYVIAPGLLQLTSMRHLDFEDPRTLPWPKSTPTPLQPPTFRSRMSRTVSSTLPDDDSEKTPVSLLTLLLITLMGYFIIFCLFLACILFGLWKIVSFQWLFGDPSNEE